MALDENIADGQDQGFFDWSSELGRAVNRGTFVVHGSTATEPRPTPGDTTPLGVVVWVGDAAPDNHLAEANRDLWCDTSTSNVWKRWDGTAWVTLGGGGGTHPDQTGWENVVVDHGAAGDGVTDDTQAIRDALAAAADGVCYFPPGTYLISGRLMPPIGASMIGAGSEASVIDATAIADDTVIMGPGNNVGATFAGFRLLLDTSPPAAQPEPNNYVGPNNFPQGSPTGTVIGLSPGPSAQDCTIRDLHISHGSTGLVLARCRNTTVESCWVGQARGHNLVIDAAPGTPHSAGVLSIRDSLVQVANNSGTATAAEEPANVRITNYTGDSNYDPRQVTFEGCKFDEPVIDADAAVSNIDVVRGQDIRVEDSLVHPPVGDMSAGGYGIRLRGLAKRVTLRDTRIAPFAETADRAPTWCLLIEAGATDTHLERLETVPLTGGDISDSGTRTVFTPPRHLWVRAPELHDVVGLPNLTQRGKMPVWLLDPDSNEAVATVPDARDMPGWSAVDVYVVGWGDGAAGDVRLRLDGDGRDYGGTAGNPTPHAAAVTVAVAADTIGRHLVASDLAVTTDLLDLAATRVASDAADTLAANFAVMGLLLEKAS